MSFWTANRLLAGAAGTLALLALLAGDPVPVREVDALTLAEWIRDRRDGLRLFDLRDSAAFADFHVPTARVTTITALEHVELNANQPVVLYSDGSGAEDAAVALRKRGLENVFVLRGGLYGWLNEVMNPQLPATISVQERAAVERVRALSQYFGGQPSVFSGPSAPSTDQIIKRLRRRTC
jgi:rhodanese-related sulfurtransferase